MTGGKRMIRVTWMTSRGPQDTGPLTEAEAMKLMEQLKSFPQSYETLTIWPVPKIEEGSAA